MDFLLLCYGLGVVLAKHTRGTRNGKVGITCLFFQVNLIDNIFVTSKKKKYADLCDF